MTQLGVTNPLASSLTWLKQLTLARGTVLPLLFLNCACLYLSLSVLHSTHVAAVDAPMPV